MIMEYLRSSGYTSPTDVTESCEGISLNDDISKTFTRYLKSINGYEPITKTEKELPSGFYTPTKDYQGRIFLKPKMVVMPKLFILPNNTQLLILDDIKNFWESEERYRKFGNVYKRNILLYSAPGNGKTSMINIICKMLINEYNGIIICIDKIDDLLAYNDSMERIRTIEPNRKIITIIEDFERLAKNDEFTALLLQTLDGNSQFDNVVTFATTNHPEVLEKRFTCRPSRFNLVIEYTKPDEENRRAYITMKLKDGGYDVESEEIKNDIERYVAKTEGYSFDFVKEAIQGIYVDGIQEEQIFKRLEELIKKNGKIKVTEEKEKPIGF